MIKFKIFKKFPHLIYGLSKRKHGSMKFFSDQKNRIIGQNRKKFFKIFRLKENQVIRTRLIHGNRVKIVSLKCRGKLIKNTDGLIAKEKNIFLSLTVADCFPVFIFNPQKEIIALVHAGWRSIIKGIIYQTIKLMEKSGYKPNDILIGIGPGIQKCHFEV